MTESISAIFGLLSSYLQIRKSESRANNSDSIQQFTEWLRRKDHQQAIEAIENNSLLSIAIAEKLTSNHDTVIAQLHHLDEVLCQVLSHLSGWSNLTLSISPNNTLSKQSLSILTQLVNKDASYFELLNGDSPQHYYYQIMDGQFGELVIDEHPFMASDLKQLVDLQLLIQRTTSYGAVQYELTRLGTDIGKQQ